MEGPRYLVVGNPENRRVRLFAQALAGLGLPAPVLLPYQTLLAGDDDLARHRDAAQGRTVLRIESPGEHPHVERLLIAAGAEVADLSGAQRISAADALRLPDDLGLIAYPRQWYLGFAALLGAWAEALPCQVVNHPADIAIMFDKRECHSRMLAAGIPVPPSLGPVGSYDELRARMAERGVQKVFIKLAYGSSASGVVAFSRGASGESAYTTVELVREGGTTRLYNARQVRRYTRHADIVEIVDTLAREGVQVEQWLPKASLAGRPFDLRVLVIGGRACHSVVRLGRSPITNLHLGNARGDMATLVGRLGEARWQAIARTCEAVAALFPRSLSCGVDLLISPDLEHHAVLEVNAFGDLLPRLTWEGLDSYSAQILALLDPATHHARGRVAVAMG